MKHSKMVPSRFKAAIAIVIGTLHPLMGCQTPLWNRQSATGTQTDRLVAAYSDLQAARNFVVIADFENPAHMDLFQLIASTSEARCELDPRGGRVATGRHALRFVSGAAGDAVVVSNARSEEWYLKRDWRDYDLLMMAVRAEQPGLDMLVATSGGRGEDRATAQTRVRLDQGWNIVRLDLADVGRHVPLDDLREIRISLIGDSNPSTVFIDDLVLASNRADLMGDSGNTEGKLYVRQAGRHWYVGAGGRFEIGFANGQIVAWYDLINDPFRRRNIVGDSVLGPTPLLFSFDGSEALSAAPPGTPVEVHPRIIEANTMRVVLTCDWRIAGVDGVLRDTLPIYGWTFTIYATGQVFASVSHRTDGAQRDANAPPRVALATSLAVLSADAVQVHIAHDTLQPSYGLVRSAPTGYAFLFAIDAACRMKVVRAQDDAGSRSVTLLGFRGTDGGTDGAAVESWACLMALGTADELTEETARRRAEAYVDPPEPEMEIGTLLPGGPSGEYSKGFDSATGSYVVVPKDGRIKMTLCPGGAGNPVGAVSPGGAGSGAERHWFNPVFTVEDSIGRQAWVYVNHILLSETERDRFGRLVFQLPGHVETTKLVEVLLRRHDS